MPTADLALTLRRACEGEQQTLNNEAATLLAACDDIAGLARLAVANRMAPWLSEAVRRHPKLGAEERFAPLHAAAMAQAMGTFSVYGELVWVLGELDRLGVPVIVLKGPVLAAELYSTPALRPYGDVDILVEEKDLAVVSSALTSRGYSEKDADEGHGSRLHECHGLFQRIFIHPSRETVIEVHCDHLQIGLEPLHMADIRRRAREVCFENTRALALEREDMFVQLCVHLGRHGFERLVWHKDIDLMVRRGELNWKEVRRKAQEQGCLDAVAYTLRVVRATLNCPLPPPALALLGLQGRVSLFLYSSLWPLKTLKRLEPQRQWRFRRVMQFSPETGVFRGGFPSLLTTGRRRDKLKVLLSSARQKT